MARTDHDDSSSGHSINVRRPLVHRSNSTKADGVEANFCTIDRARLRRRQADR